MTAVTFREQIADLEAKLQESQAALAAAQDELDGARSSLGGVIKHQRQALAAEQAAHAETRMELEKFIDERLVQIGHIQYQRVLKEHAEKQRDLDRGRISAQAESLSIQAEQIARLTEALREIRRESAMNNRTHTVALIDAALATPPAEPPSEPVKLRPTQREITRAQKWPDPSAATRDAERGTEA